MRDAKRIDRILDLIKEYWTLHPDFRFGQLLINLGIADNSFRVWRNEDEDLEVYLKEFMKKEIEKTKKKSENKNGKPKDRQ